MTGRIRTIKPELLEDEKTSSLSDTEFRVFVSLLLLADDYGNMRGTWSFIAGQAFHSAPPLRGREDAFERLIDVGLLHRYRVRGQVYVHVSGWEKHQRVDKPGKPRCPGPTEADEGESTARMIRETPVTDLRPPTPTGTSDPERADRARTHEATSSAPPDAPIEPTPPSPPPARATPEAPHGALARSLIAEVVPEADDAPQPRRGASVATVEASTPVVVEVLSAGDEPSDVLDYLSDFGARDAIDIYNEHRHPSLPAWDTDTLGVPAGLLLTMATDAAREKKSGAAPPWPMHRRSGWVAFAERTHAALWLHEPDQRFDLAWWFRGARRGAVECEGYEKRQRLAAGGPNGFDLVRRPKSANTEQVRTLYDNAKRMKAERERRERAERGIDEPVGP